jgi:hypothetical protein
MDIGQCSPEIFKAWQEYKQAEAQTETQTETQTLTVARTLALRTLEQTVACAKFFNAYTKLMHMECYLVAHILEPGTNMLDIVCEHNILENAKAQVVQAYLPFTVSPSSRDVNTEKV